MSSHISFIQGTTQTIPIELVDGVGEPLEMAELVGATAQFLLRVQPTDVVDILNFNTVTNPTKIEFSAVEPTLTLSFVPADTSGLLIRLYFYEVKVTLADGSVLAVVPWSMFDLNLGGAAATPLPPFTNTVKIDHDYQLPGDLSYYTPGGTPIENAQIRLYYKSDYDAGNLASPIGVTMTDAGGRWLNPILVPPGYLYIVRFEKPNEWGPNTQEIFA